MFEIDDPIRRARVLARLGGVEDTAFIKLDGEIVKGVPEEDLDRTNAEGKASSVQFIHFAFTPQQITLFREPNRQVVIGFSHPEYSHMAGRSRSRPRGPRPGFRLTTLAASPSA